MKTKREGISFRIFAQGDATVGDGCLSATVIIPELLVDDDVVRSSRSARRRKEPSAAETRDALVAKARNHELPMAERKLSIGLARVEQCRLDQIREDIKRFA